MTKIDALEIVSSYIDSADWVPEEHKDAVFVARELCFIDLLSTDVEEWFSWTPEEVTIMFHELAVTSIEEFAESVDAEEASSDLIMDALGIKVDSTNRDSASLGIEKGAAGLFIALGAYIAIQGQVRKKFYEDL
tara:strand:+ start:1235 stop:1636 length:402 start_codon:yes stop_codon:yes gene_type:complete